MNCYRCLVLKIAAVAVILFAAASPATAAANPVPADQPMLYTVELARKVRVACDLDSLNGPEGLAAGEIVYNYRQCFQKAGHDFDKSILHFAADYGNNLQSFGNISQR